MNENLPELQSVFADRYVIEREVGRGGMSVVFLAEDRGHRRRVALKIFRPDLAGSADSNRFARFLREVTLATGLSHLNIVPVYDVGEAAGFVYLTMPYIDGGTLRDRIARERQLPVADALVIGLEVASALVYAHARGVIHRDIKPGNVLLSAEGAMVADFGLAGALAAGHAHLTASGMVVGTPEYMSPEQATGRLVDGRSDVYSMGCLLYEMVAGQPPFAGGSALEVLMRHATEDPSPLENLRPVIPEHLSRVIKTALAKAPAERFANTQELAVALGEQLVETRGFTARKTGAFFGGMKHLDIELGNKKTATVGKALESRPLALAYRKVSIGSRILAGLKSLLPHDDRVLVGGAAPESTKPGEEFVAWFVAYRKVFEPTVRLRLSEQSMRVMPRMDVQRCHWAPGTTVAVRVSGNHLQISPQREEFVWDGDWSMVSFDVTVNRSAPLGVTVLKFDVFIGPLRVARVRLDVSIVAKPKSNRLRHSIGLPARTAFASYAVGDRNEVLGRISSIATTTGLDVFMDCLSLRPGEKWKRRLRREIRKRDLFLLFWSRQARDSEWVEWEWRTALGLRGLDVIQPHPLCSAAEVPPPPELEPLHFGDLYMLVRHAYGRVDAP